MDHTNSSCTNGNNYHQNNDGQAWRLFLAVIRIAKQHSCLNLRPTSYATHLKTPSQAAPESIPMRLVSMPLQASAANSNP